MAASSYLAYFDNSTLANFVAWAKPVADFLKAQTGILTQTADTGQVNWATISTVPAANGYVFESYKLVDPAGTTYNPPLYMRIGYGTSGFGQPMLRIEWGTGTTGAATAAPTGLLSTVCSQIAAAATSSGPADAVNQWPCYLSSDNSSYVSVHLFNGWHAASGTCMAFVFERSRNADGSVNADGLSIFNYSTQNASSTITTTTSGTLWQSFSWAKPTPGWGPGNQYTPPCAFSNEFDLQIGTTVYTLPIVVQYGKPEQGQFTSMVVYNKNDLPDRTTFQQTVNGAQHTYLTTGSQLNGGSIVTVGLALAIRYE